MNFSDFSTPEKEFCCLKMKEVIQAQIYEEIKDMTDEEVLAYYKRPTTLGPFKPYYLQKQLCNQ